MILSRALDRGEINRSAVCYAERAGASQNHLMLAAMRPAARFTRSVNTDAWTKVREVIKKSMIHIGDLQIDGLTADRVAQQPLCAHLDRLCAKAETARQRNSTASWRCSAHYARPTAIPDTGGVHGFSVSAGTPLSTPHRSLVCSTCHWQLAPTSCHTSGTLPSYRRHQRLQVVSFFDVTARLRSRDGPIAALLYWVGLFYSRRYALQNCIACCYTITIY